MNLSQQILSTFQAKSSLTYEILDMSNCYIDEFLYSVYVIVFVKFVKAKVTFKCERSD